MLKSHVTIICTSRNDDGNSVGEIAEAVKCCGGEDLQTSDDGVVEATIPTALMPDVVGMAGVCCVRADMTFDAK